MEKREHPSGLRTSKIHLEPVKIHLEPVERWLLRPRLHETARNCPSTELRMISRFDGALRQHPVAQRSGQDDFSRVADSSDEPNEIALELVQHAVDEKGRRVL